MGQSVRTGATLEDFKGSGNPVSGELKLELFAEEFKSVFQQTQPAPGHLSAAHT